MNDKDERSESTMPWDRPKGNRSSCQGALGPQWPYIIRWTRGTEPKARVGIRLRKTGFDVLTKNEMIEKGLQKTDGLLKRPGQQGQKGKGTTCYMTLRSLQRRYARVLMLSDVFSGE